MKIIDFRARPNTKEYMTYFDTPGKRERQERKLGYPIPGVQTLEAFMGDVEEAGISSIVYTGRDNQTLTKWIIPNDYVAEAARKYPKRIIPMAGIDPLKPRREVLAEVERCMKTLGMKGVSMDVSRCQMGPNDRRLYHIYERCIALDVPVVLTMGPSAGGRLYLKYNSPMLVDELAIDLPELKIVCAHAGWPFTSEMIGVAYRHENVYFDNSAYHTMPGANALVEAANTIIGDKMLFATAFPFNPLKPIVEYFTKLPFKPDVLENVMYRNAARLLKQDF